MCGYRIAALFYVLGRQTGLQRVANTPNGVNQSTVPGAPPTPVPSPTLATVVQTDQAGPIDCTANEKTQLHDNCDTKDCDTDASTVAFGISAGTAVTKLGISKQSQKYRWEKVSV